MPEENPYSKFVEEENPYAKYVKAPEEANPYAKYVKPLPMQAGIDRMSQFESEAIGGIKRGLHEAKEGLFNTVTGFPQRYSEGVQGAQQWLPRNVTALAPIAGVGNALFNSPAGEFAGNLALAHPHGPMGTPDYLTMDRRGRPIPQEDMTHAGQVVDLNDRLHRLSTQAEADSVEMKQRGAAMLKEYGPDIEPKESSKVQEKIYRHLEGDRNAPPLNEKEQKVLNHILPLKQEEAELHQWLNDHGAPMDQVQPTPGYMHRIVEGEEPGRDWQEGDIHYLNPLPGRITEPRAKGGLSTSAPSQEERRFFSIENEAGERRLVAQGKDGDLHLVGSSHVDLLTNKAKVGDRFRWGGQQWTMKHAYTSEIEKATSLRYRKNAFVVTAQNVRQMRIVKRNIQELERTKNSPWFRTNSAKAGDEVAKLHKDWIETKHPNFNGLVMEPRIAHTLDDFMPREHGELARSVIAANRFLIQSLFWSPMFHAYNVFGHAFAGRSWDNFTAPGFARAARALPVALKEVITQGPKYQEFLREGGALLSSSTENRTFMESTLRMFGDQIMREPTKWQQIAKTLDYTGVPQMVESLYKASNKGLWVMGDVLMMQRYLEVMQTGRTARQAIEEVERHVPNYRIADQIMGSRKIALAMKSPLISTFNPYHYGVFKSWSNTIKDMVSKDPSIKGDGVGQLFAVGMLATVIGEGMDMATRAWTGDKKAHFTRTYGPLAPIEAIKKMEKGTGDYSTFVQGVFSLAPATKALIETLENADLFLKQPLTTIDLNAPPGKSALNSAAQAMEKLAQIGFEPYQVAAGAWRDKQTGLPVPERIARAFLDQAVGVRRKPEELTGKARSAIMYQSYHRKTHPAGPFEDYARKGLDAIYKRIHTNAND